MARKPLDAATEGPTAKLEVRVPLAIREAAEATLEPGERLASFVRTAIVRETERRMKKRRK